jgi:hypothetical protein
MCGDQSHGKQASKERAAMHSFVDPSLFFRSNVYIPRCFTLVANAELMNPPQRLTTVVLAKFPTISRDLCAGCRKVLCLVCETNAFSESYETVSSPP